MMPESGTRPAVGLQGRRAPGEVVAVPRQIKNPSCGLARTVWSKAGILSAPETKGLKRYCKRYCSGFGGDF